MMDRRGIFVDRVIEYDSLAVVLMGISFVAVSALTSWLVAGAAQRADIAVIVAGAIVGAATIGAWIVGYERRAAIPAMALVFLIAIIALPMAFDMNGAFLQEVQAGGASRRVYVAMGVYIGGLGIAFLSLMLFGFFGPFVGAYLGLRRGEVRARETLALHGLLTGAALALTLIFLVWL